MFKILEQNGIDNENIDGGAFNNFAAGNRDGILKGVLNECSLVAEGNSISIGTGVIILQGIRVKITDPEIISVSSVPYESVRYQIVAQIIMTEGNMTCSFFLRTPSELVKDNFYNSGKGNGTYQQELGRVTHGTNGALTDIQRTLDIISGGGGTGTQAIEIGNVSTNMIDAGLPAEVDVDTRVEGEKEVIDFKFSFPESSAKTIYTVKNLTVKETNNRQFLSDVFSTEEEIANSDMVCLQELDISSLSLELQNYVNSIKDSGMIYLSRVSPKAFFAILGSVASPELLEVSNSGAVVLYLAGNKFGQYQLFGTVLSDQSGSAVSAVFDNAGNPLVNKYVKPDTGIPERDLSSDVQESLAKAKSALQSIPIATPSNVGGVKPSAKTSEMTQEVGVDNNGNLWTKEGGNSSGTNSANKNLLINPNFKINQRGKTTYSANGYGVDRWKSNGVSYSVQSGGTVEIVTVGAWSYLYQIIENYALLRGKTVTLSVKFKNFSYTAGVPSIAIRDGVSTPTIPVLGDGVTKLTTTISESATQLYIYALYNNSSVIANIDTIIEWVKLEIGDAATEFVPPDEATELLKCQRFFQKITLHGGATASSGTTTVYAAIPIPTTMRANPTITVNKMPDLRGNGISTKPSSISFQGLYNNFLQINVQATGLTGNHVYALSNGEIFADAEI